MVTVTRFAPSPTGYLHLGHAFSALTAWHTARAAGGRFLLRIEDIDPARCRAEFTHGIIQDLNWLGIDWNGPIRYQSSHMDDYRRGLMRLQALGVIYPCFCSRADIAREIARSGLAPHEGETVRYPGTCRLRDVAERTSRIDSGQAFAWRLNAAEALRQTGMLTWRDRDRGEQQTDLSVVDDVVLARRDTPTSYHLSVTLDDAAQGVTLVTRGQDLFCQTHVHRLLQALLGLPVPDYAHHRLLTNEAGQRLSKRDGARTLAALRAEAITPADIHKNLGFQA